MVTHAGDNVPIALGDCFINIYTYQHRSVQHVLAMKVKLLLTCLALFYEDKTAV